MDEVPISLVTSIIDGGASVAAGILALGGSILGALYAGKAMERRKNGGTETRIHDHITDGFTKQLEETRRHYESLLNEYRNLHDERSKRIDELTAQVHALRDEVEHLRETLAAHNIPIPPRVGLRSRPAAPER